MSNQTTKIPAVRVEASHMGYRIFLDQPDGLLIGWVEEYSALDIAVLPKGTACDDVVYVTNHVAYRTLADAVLSVTLGFFDSGDDLDQLPDYF